MFSLKKKKEIEEPNLSEIIIEGICQKIIREKRDGQYIERNVKETEEWRIKSTHEITYGVVDADILPKSWNWAPAPRDYDAHAAPSCHAGRTQEGCRND